MFLLLFLYILITILLNDRFDDSGFLSKLIIVPIIILLSLPLRNENYKKPLYGFLIGSGLLLMLSLFKLISHYFEHQSLKLDVGREINVILMGERPFLGFIYLLSFILCLYLWRIEKIKHLKIALLVGCLVFSSFILFISARLSILSLIIVLFFSVFYTVHKKRNFLIILGAVSIIGLLVFLNPNFTKRFTAGFEQKEFNVEKLITLEPRSHIWECAVEVGDPKSLPIMGFGFRNTIDKLSECYASRTKFLNEDHKSYFVKSRFNTHNQFLNFYLSSGVISMILFVLFFAFLFKSNYSNYITFSLVLALFLFCCFENVLSRQIGAMLFGTVYAMLNLLKTHNNHTRHTD